MRQQNWHRLQKEEQQNGDVICLHPPISFHNNNKYCISMSNRGTLHPCRVNQNDCRASLYLFIGPDPWRLQFIIVTVKLNPRQGGLTIARTADIPHYVHGKYLDRY